MNIGNTYRAASNNYQANPAKQEQDPEQNLAALYGTDQVTIGQSSRGMAESLLLADCLSDVACTNFDKVCHGY